jgi:hypothetical protein
MLKSHLIFINQSALADHSYWRAILTSLQTKAIKKSFLEHFACSTHNLQRFFFLKQTPFITKKARFVYVLQIRTILFRLSSKNWKHFSLSLKFVDDHNLFRSLIIYSSRPVYFTLIRSIIFTLMVIKKQWSILKYDQHTIHHRESFLTQFIQLLLSNMIH